MTTRSQPSVAVGRRVRALRVGARIPLNRLAGETGLRPSDLLGIEQGRTRPSLEALGRIARVLGISLLDLVKTATPAPPAPPRRARQSRFDGLDHIAQAITDLPHEFGDKLDAVEAAVVKHAMTVCGTQTAAARLLGLERKAFVRRWLKAAAARGAR